MAALAPDHDLIEDETITHFAVAKAEGRCRLCVVPNIIQEQAMTAWDHADVQAIPFTPADMMQVAKKRCGGCLGRGWPKVSESSGVLYLHVASKRIG
ncbi:hypothetical protein [Sinorhizobium fredii]|uniref:hypothetical protein n=1 Tax=Rhizobium fredii TaxID=380 RepID=UPI003515E34B